MSGVPKFKLYETVDDTLIQWSRELNNLAANLRNDTGYLTVSNIKSADLSDDVREKIISSVTWDDITDMVRQDDLDGLIRVGDVIDIAVTSIMSTSGHMYVNEDGVQVWESDDGLSATVQSGAGFAVGSRVSTEDEFSWTTVIDKNGVVMDNVVTKNLNAEWVFAGQLKAAFGSFLSLVAGVDGGARVEMGKDAHNDPLIDMYNDSNEKELALRKDGLYVGEYGRMVKYATGDVAGVAIFVE